MLNILKKVSKFTLGVCITFIFVMALLYILLRSHPVQQYAIQKVTHFLSTELKTKVSIKAIDFELFDKLVLEGLYIEDLQKDTLFYIGKLKTSFDIKSIFNPVNQTAKVDFISLENAFCYLSTTKGIKGMNLDFLIDYFDPPRPKNPKKKHIPFILKTAFIDLKNVNFRMHNKPYTPINNGIFDDNYFYFKHINATLSEFILVDDSLNFKIKNLMCQETQSKLYIKKLNSNTIISSKLMSFDKIELKTPYSYITDKIEFRYRNYNTLSDFIDSVQIKANIQNSKIHWKDIACFSKEVIPYPFIANIDGNISGSIANLNGKKVSLTLGEHTEYIGDFNMEGLPDFDNTYLDLNIKTFKTNYQDLTQLGIKDLPLEIEKLGTISYIGEFTGLYSDFSSKGDLSTNLGNANIDINLNMPLDQSIPSYSGYVKTDGFELGTLLNNKDIGKLIIDTKISGKGFNIDQLNAEFDGKITEANFQGIAYKNININGTFNKKFFDGKMVSNDPNIQLSFDGKIDFNNQKPIYDFKTSIPYLNIERLAIGNLKTLKAKEIKLDMTGNDLDNLLGTAFLKDLELYDGKQIFKAEFLNILSTNNLNQKEIDINSDLLHANIKGQYVLAEAETILASILNQILPDKFPKPVNNISPTQFYYDITVKNTSFFTNMFMPELKIQNLISQGSFNSLNNLLDFSLSSDRINYQNYQLKNIELYADKPNSETLKIKTSIKDIFQNDSIFTANTFLNTEISKNKINFNLESGDTSFLVSTNTNGSVEFVGKDLLINLNPSLFYLKNQKWDIYCPKTLKYQDNKLWIDSLNIYNQNQNIGITGYLLENGFNDLSLKINNLNINAFNPFIKTSQSKIAGITNGDITLNGLFEKPQIISNINIAQLQIGSDTIGDFKIKSESDIQNPLKMSLNAIASNGLINNLNIDGIVNLTTNEESLNLDLDLKNTKLKSFENFTVGLFSNLSGEASAHVKITGSPSKPELQGKIDVKQGSMFVDYIGTKVLFENQIELTKKVIDLGKFKISDGKNGTGMVSGKIYHNFFDDIKFDININNLKNFEALNLNETQNSYFYGKAFIDGQLQVLGPINNILLKIKAKTLPNTKIFLPLTSKTENIGPDYIKVVDLHGDIPNQNIKKIEGISMDFEFDVTKDAEIDLIFDAKNDDVIHGKGHGVITMKMNTSGDFALYGSYEIDDGNYNFTAFNNLINESLKLKKGGKIVWNGNPYTAIVDLTASITKNTNISALNSISSNNGQSISKADIECLITMSGNLFKPDIKLGLDIPQQNSGFTNSDFTRNFNQIKADQDETNRQFVNIIMWQSFIDIGTANTTSSTANFSVVQQSLSQFFSTQVNNWLKTIIPGWDVSIDLLSGQASQNQINEMKVSLKKKFFNKLELSGNAVNAVNYDVNLNYLLDKEGKITLKAFYKVANDPSNANSYPISTAGVGFYYRKEFNYFFAKLRNKKQNNNK